MAADDDARTAETPTGSRARGCWWLQVVESSPDGVLIVEGDTIVYANRAMEELADSRAGELTGRSVEDLVPAQVRPRHRSLRERFSEAAHLRPLAEGADLLLCRADGSVLPVDIGLAPLTADHRDLILATVRDVSARRAEQAERGRLARILQIVPDGVIVVDATTGDVVDVNEAVCTMLGHSTGSLRGMPATRLSATGDPEFLRRASSVLSVQRMRTLGGDTLDCEVHAVAFEGTLGPEVVNVVRDVGPRLELERRARAGHEAFRAVFDHAPVGLAVTRRDVRGVRTIVRTNDALARMFGYQRHELEGQEPWVLTPSHAHGEGPTAGGADDEGLSSDAVVIQQYVRRDGSTLWAEVRATTLVLDGEEAQLSLVHALDVTERVEADRARRRQGIVTECLADVSNAALAHEDVSKVFDRIARGALAATDADAAAVHLSVAERTRRVAAATGDLAATLSKELERSTARPSTTGAADGDDEESRGGAPSIGAVLAVPFGPEESLPSGRVVVCRKPGRPPFSPADAAELTRLANQSQVALHLARARDDQQRLMLIEERQRIARDLHDTVIQDMIAMGMEMSSELSEPSDAQQRTVSAERLERLEDMVVSLRRAVFQLRDTSGGRSLAREVTDAVAQASRILPTPPTVTFAGPLELVAAELVDDLIAVLREALANVTRHAGATKVVVSVTVTNERVLLVVDDDGIGLTGSSQSGGFGVLGFTERARLHGGSVSVGPGPSGGTRVAWGCPLLR